MLPAPTIYATPMPWHTLKKMHADGVDIYAALPLLATYMGHADIVSAEYYLCLDPSAWAGIESAMATTVRPFADMLARFLTVYLPITRACSRNTICAYRDAFTLLLQFMNQQRATPPDQVTFADFIAPERSGFPRLVTHRPVMLHRHRQPTPGRAEIVLPLRPIRSPRTDRPSSAGPGHQGRPSHPNRPSLPAWKRSNCSSNTANLAGPETWRY